MSQTAQTINPGAAPPLQVELREPLSHRLQARQITTSAALQTFIRLELTSQKRSASTVRWYSQRLDQLIEFLGSERPLVDVMEIDLEDYMATLAEQSVRYGGDSTRPQQAGALSVFTLRGHARAIKRLFRWVMKKKLLEVDLAAELPIPPKPKIGKKGIEECDRRAMLETVAAPLQSLIDQPPSDWQALDEDLLRTFRNLAILLFVSSTGCRLGGVVHLRLSDIDLSNADDNLRRRAYVVEKGEKGRPVFFNGECHMALVNWLRVRPQCASDHVFTGLAHGQTQWEPMREGGVYEVFRQVATDSGVKSRPGALWSPHQWRHRFGRYMLSKGLDLARLSQIMGHSTVQITVEHYGQFAVDQLQEGYNQFMD